MGASSVATTENHQVDESAGQVIAFGTTVPNDDPRVIIDHLVPMSDNAPKVRSITTHGGRQIRLKRVCHFNVGAQKVGFYEKRVRGMQTLLIGDIKELHLE